jgi:hypothetical protein
MISLYSLEFSVLYAKRIPYLQPYVAEIEESLRTEYWELKMPVLEQMLSYTILTNFFMMISAFKSAMAL